MSDVVLTFVYKFVFFFSSFFRVLLLLLLLVLLPNCLFRVPVAVDLSTRRQALVSCARASRALRLHFLIGAGASCMRLLFPTRRSPKGRACARRVNFRVRIVRVSCRRDAMPNEQAYRLNNGRGPLCYQTPSPFTSPPVPLLLFLLSLLTYSSSLLLLFSYTYFPIPIHISCGQCTQKNLDFKD